MSGELSGPQGGGGAVSCRQRKKKRKKNKKIKEREELKRESTRRQRGRPRGSRRKKAGGRAFRPHGCRVAGYFGLSRAAFGGRGGAGQQPAAQRGDQATHGKDALYCSARVLTHGVRLFAMATGSYRGLRVICCRTRRSAVHRVLQWNVGGVPGGKHCVLRLELSRN